MSEQLLISQGEIVFMELISLEGDKSVFHCCYSI